MSLEKRREAAAKGGRAQGKKTNSGNFSHNPKRAAKAGAKGGKAERSKKQRDSLLAGNQRAHPPSPKLGLPITVIRLIVV